MFQVSWSGQTYGAGCTAARNRSCRWTDLLVLVLYLLRLLVTAVQGWNDGPAAEKEFFLPQANAGLCLVALPCHPDVEAICSSVKISITSSSPSLPQPFCCWFKSNNSKELTRCLSHTLCANPNPLCWFKAWGGGVLMRKLAGVQNEALVKRVMNGDGFKGSKGCL